MQAPAELSGYRVTVSLSDHNHRQVILTVNNKRAILPSQFVRGNVRS